MSDNEAAEAMLPTNNKRKDSGRRAILGGGEINDILAL